MRTHRPVKLVNTREEAFTMNGPRLPVTNYIRSGVMKDGTITAREAYTIFDVGAYLGAGPNSGIGHGIGAYRVPNFRLRSYGVYTNKIYVGSYRASGVADMTFAVESHMDHIAQEIGMDPYDLREKNALREGDVSVSGAVVPGNGLMETLAAIKEKINWPRSLEDGHGIGLALCEWRSGSGPSTAAISVNDDGTVSLLTGSVDISGSDTSLAAIAAEALGIPMDQVIVAKRDTDLAPYTGQSGGSRIVYSQGTAVKRAADDTLNKLMLLASERLGVPQEALGSEDGRVYVLDNAPQGMTFAQLAAASITSRGGPIIGMASLSNMPYTPVFAAQAAEVKVDRETGNVRVLRYIQAQDVGTAINPMAVEGQLDGGVVQGIGRALTEDQQFDAETGAVRNPSFASYLMPLAIDLPESEIVLINVPAPDGPFGARAVAEPPGFGPPAAIANAIYDAVGVRINELPLSGERVLAALQGRSPEIDLDVDALRKGGGHRSRLRKYGRQLILSAVNILRRHQNCESSVVDHGLIIFRPIGVLHAGRGSIHLSQRFPILISRGVVHGNQACFPFQDDESPPVVAAYQNGAARIPSQVTQFGPVGRRRKRHPFAIKAAGNDAYLRGAAPAKRRYGPVVVFGQKLSLRFS